MSDLREELVRLRPRERAGARSADRFEYQRDWAICRLLHLHESTTDYLIAFDIFDDVLVLNSATTPDRIAFFQVKTRATPPMRLKELLSRKQGENGPLLSMLGKLYHNRIVFPEHTQALTMVANVPFEVALADGSASSTKPLLCCTELDAPVQARIAEQLKEEHALAQAPVFADCLFLEVSDLPLTGHDTYVRGKLAEFLDRLNPTGSFRVALVYRTIADEVKRKNNYHSDVPGFATFVQQKAISRSEFTQILTRVGAYEDIDTLSNRIEARLNSEHVSVFTIRTLRDQLRRFAVDRLSSAANTFRHLEDVVKRHLTRAGEEAPQHNDLMALLDAVVTTVRADQRGGEYSRYDNDYLKAVALTILYEQ